MLWWWEGRGNIKRCLLPHPFGVVGYQLAGSDDVPRCLGSFGRQWDVFGHVDVSVGVGVEIEAVVTLGTSIVGRGDVRLGTENCDGHVVKGWKFFELRKFLDLTMVGLRNSFGCQLDDVKFSLVHSVGRDNILPILV
jgi:hypothetical protein